MNGELESTPIDVCPSQNSTWTTADPSDAAVVVAVAFTVPATTEVPGDVSVALGLGGISKDAGAVLARNWFLAGFQWVARYEPAGGPGLK